MSIYSVDTEFIVNEITPQLKDLCERCTVKAREAPWNSEKDSGQTRYKLAVMTDIVHENWAQMVYLINKSISFLTSASGTVDENDSIMKVDPVTGAILTQKEIKIRQHDEEIMNMYNSRPKGRYALEGDPSLGRPFKVSGGCTWYAVARYRNANGLDTDFDVVDQYQGDGHWKPGDANNWQNVINKDYFNIYSRDQMGLDEYYARIRPNSIAEDIHGDFGHVVYIESVQDGYVYFSDGNVYTADDPSTFGAIRQMTIEDFAEEYEYIFSAE